MPRSRTQAPLIYTALGPVHFGFCMKLLGREFQSIPHGLGGTS